MPTPESIACRAATLRPFVCSSTDGGLDAAWVHMAGELDIATVPQLEQTLRETQLQARLVVLDLRELAFMDAPACTRSSTRAPAPGRRSPADPPARPPERRPDLRAHR